MDKTNMHHIHIEVNNIKSSPWIGNSNIKYTFYVNNYSHTIRTSPCMKEWFDHASKCFSPCFCGGLQIAFPCACRSFTCNGTWTFFFAQKASIEL